MAGVTVTSPPSSQSQSQSLESVSTSVSAAANRLSRVLIEESAVLGGLARHVEWIERELRSMAMQAFSEQVEQREQEQRDLKAWAVTLMDIAGNAEDVIETFVIESVKGRRRGVVYWYHKYKAGKELKEICEWMRDISQSLTRIKLNTDVSVTVETPGEASSISTAAVVDPAMAMEKLDRILSENVIIGDEAMEIVEQVKLELGDLRDIVSNLKSTPMSERENVWLEEVKEVCNNTKAIAEKFIANDGIEERRWSTMGRVEDEEELKKQMEKQQIRTQIGDAVRRSLIYGVGGKDAHMVNRQTTTPVPNLSLERSIIELLPFFVYSIALPLLPFAPSTAWPWYLLFLVICEAFSIVVNRGGGGTEQMKKKRKSGGVLRVLNCLFFHAIIVLTMIILSWFLPLEAVILLRLSCSWSFYQVIVWTVSLWRSLDKNLKCAERDLALMNAFLRDTQSAEGLNERQRVWMGQIRVVAQNGHSLIAAAGHGSLRRIKFAKDINGLLKDILSISDRKTTYGIVANIQGSPPSMQQQKAQHATSGDDSGAVTAEHLPPPSSYRPIILTGLQEKVQSIRGEKQLMDALFRDVQDVTEKLDERNRIWVVQMRGIAREMESVINDYGTKLEHKPILMYMFKYWTRRVTSNKIDEIRNKLEDVSRRRKTHGLMQLQKTRRATVQILRTSTESNVIGFDDYVQVLVPQLVSGEKRRCVTCVVGIGGTGKTELANLIFQDKAVVDHFDIRVWVSAPSNCTPQQLLELIIPEIPTMTLEDLACTKFLLVIDGLQNLQVLDSLNKAIPDMSTASRLVVTTRNANVAQPADNIFVQPLQLFDDESSWVLFTRHLKVDIPEQLMEVGREIVMKCGGLPSEILKIAKLSRGRVTLEEWSYVLQQVNETKTTWFETLNAVNTDLPQILRRCLSYFELFPAEYGIPVRRLTALWVAESLVDGGEDNEEPPEQVAERYLTELIDRNMVQIVKRKHNGKVKTCRLPNALREIWWTKANRSKFLQGDTGDPDKSIIRRVADHLEENDTWHKHIHGDTDTTSASVSLRDYYQVVVSFLSFDTQAGSRPGQEIGRFLKQCILSHCFLLLRVLDLERVYKPKLPENIAKLSRLRYLGLRWTYLESLPSSISGLLTLQTLDLKHTYIHTLPSSIWKMHLRHLFLSETFRSRFPPQPRGHSPSDLQTLLGLFVDEETPVKGGLDRLVNVRKLGLACQSMSPRLGRMKAQLGAVAGWIEKLEYLHSLRLKSRDEKGHPWILILKSFQKHTNLTDMYLLGSLSSSILSQFPRSLVELTLSHSKLRDDPMKLLMNFPYLRSLCLFAESYVGKTMVCISGSFPQLHVLKFWVLAQLEEWKIEEGALPCLRQLEIRSCLSLKMLPDGLKHVNTLLELKLTNMPIEITADKRKKIPPNCKVSLDNFQQEFHQRT